MNEKLGSLFKSLEEYQKTKKYYEKALAIAIEVGDRQKEGRMNRRLGNVFYYLGEYKKSKEYAEKALAIMIEIGDKHEEGATYECLGGVFNSLGKNQNAKEYCMKALAIAIEIGDRRGESATYGCLGTVFHSLGECQRAKEYQEKALAIAIEIGDRRGEGTRCNDLGAVFSSLGDKQKAKEYYEKSLAIAIEIGHRRGEGRRNGNLGAVLYSLTKEYFEKAVDVSRAIGHRKSEASALTGLASVFASVNENLKAKEHCEKALTISRECEYRDLEAKIYITLGEIYHSLHECGKAEDCLEKAYSISSQTGNKLKEFESLLNITRLKVSHSQVAEAKDYLIQCIGKYEQIRTCLEGNSEFKISLLEEHGTFPYKLLSRLLCDTEQFQDALYVEELGRARVLAELIADKNSVESHISANPNTWFGIENVVKRETNCVFLYISYEERQVLLWVLKANGDTFFRKSNEVELNTLDAEQVCDVEGIFKKSAAGFGVLPTSNCEDRSLDDNVTTSPHGKSRTSLPVEQTKDTERIHHLCYEWIVAPVAHLLTEPEIIIVPDRFSYRVPFAALRDNPAGKYLSERYRLRIVPSLRTLQHIQECPVDYHSQTDALIVGDPKVGEVYYNGRLLDVTPLLCANKEARMVGELLGVEPLLGGRATKQAVLQAISSRKTTS
ncbi:tetratricopeptide repeat protein 28-like [Stylophora pistillata]|uniref:tetratricopeptide repeat protein 28-like n=1 Tax=Stylophora pistillata TaxID=50429 RepID=UPI000C04CC15|nr:tetratricopeptide repeat protein 28-like [Stylophora pistillata]